jgi:8-amino-7-oxononanoate synthase
MGVSGAFVAGSGDAIELLVQRARPFIFSTAAPPAVAAALAASLEVVVSEPERRERLLERARYLRGRLGLDGDSPILPVIIGENDKAVAVARELQAAGFDVRAIRPPTVPAGTARLRVAVNEGVSEEVLDRFVAALKATTKA